MVRGKSRYLVGPSCEEERRGEVSKGKRKVR